MANDLVASILDQNIKARQGRAAQTSQFFDQQTAKLAADLTALEKRIADFKKANEAYSPDTLNDRREQLAKLQSQIADIDQAMTFGTDLKDNVETKEQLKSLKSRLQASQLLLKNTKDQRVSLEPLYKKGFVTKSRLLDSRQPHRANAG